MKVSPHKNIKNNLVCRICKITRSVSDFHKSKRFLSGRSCDCTICLKEKYQKVRVQQNTKRNKDRLLIKDQENIKKKNRYHSDVLYRESTLNSQKQYYLKNRIRMLEKQQLYESKYKEKRNKRERERRKNDIQYRLSVYIRNRIGYFVKQKNRDVSPIKSLGCPVSDLVSYLESKFTNGMDWKNYGSGPGKWEIDHIEPLCSFDLRDSDQFLIATNYLNLKPIWHDDHVTKTTEDFKKSTNKRRS